MVVWSVRSIFYSRIRYPVGNILTLYSNVFDPVDPSYGSTKLLQLSGNFPFALIGYAPFVLTTFPHR